MESVKEILHKNHLKRDIILYHQIEYDYRQQQNL